MAFVSLNDISKSYVKPVLANVDLHLSQGESVALVGANGAGKSTLIKIILGLVQPTGGTGSLMGFPLGDAQSLRRVGYLPEIPAYWPEFSARELLEQFAKLRGLNWSSVKDRAEDLLSEVGLSHRASAPMAGYSKGMLQRAGVAQLLLHDPELIVLDEPMSGLDPRAQEKLRQILLKLREKGKTMIVSSHSLEDIRSLCSRVVVIEKTKVTENGPTAEVLDKLVEKYRSSEPWDEDPSGETNVF